MENNQTKHTLAIVSAILGAISIITIIILISNISKMNDDNGGLLLGLSLYTAIPSIICASLAKKKGNTEIFPNLGLICSAITLFILIIFLVINA